MFSTLRTLSQLSPRIKSLGIILCIQRPYLVTGDAVEKSKTISTLQNNWKSSTISKDENCEFMTAFPDVMRDLTEATNKYKCKDAAKWFAKALQYNVPRGKKNRGILTVLTYKSLVKSEDLTEENIKLAHYLGWCVEVLQSFLLVTDDIMDNSRNRRGQPCWHTIEDVGLKAINDAHMIEIGIFIILKKHFRHLACYVDLMELFHDMLFATTCGQSLDMLYSRQKVTSFSMEKYDSIIMNKTAYYSFYLPFALGMHLAGYKNVETFRQSKRILLEMVHYHPVQDDFFDCFGDPEITGKIGSDIENNKCSWLAVVCMQRANAEQKTVMADCYGQSDPVKVAQVKELYQKLGLPSIYHIYEKETFQMIQSHIHQATHSMPDGVFQKIFNRFK